jgi:D-tyrosyl-tRNA(Tyr) deacylase
VTVDDEVVGRIGPGLVVLLGVTGGDTETEARFLAEKTANLRIFADAAGKFNLSALDVSGEVLVVSQFTLYADARRGRRPSFTRAAAPEVAEPMVEQFAKHVEEQGLKVARGRFGAHMQVRIVNDGPVTIFLEA